MSSSTLCDRKINVKCSSDVGIVTKVYQRLIQLKSTIKRWEQNAVSRRQLAELSPHMLKDIGISSTEVVAESDKPFWKD